MVDTARPDLAEALEAEVTAGADAAQVRRLWKRALEQLKLQMTSATFDTWLRGTEVIEANHDTWTVGVAHAYALDWLGARLMPVILRTCRSVAGRDIDVQFVVHAPPVPTPRPAAELHSAGQAAAALEGAQGDESEENEGDPEDLGAETILEAVQEERVTVRGDGTSLVWTDFYIKLKLAFRRKALGKLRGAKLSVFLCLALHIDRYGVAAPGIDRLCQETGYSSRSTVCSALEDLVGLRIVEKLSPNRWGNDRYRVLGYAWFGRDPAPSLWEEEEESG